MALGALGLLLLQAPPYWRAQRIGDFSEAWNRSLVGEADAIEKLILRRPEPSRSFPEDAAEVRRMLEAHPTLVALIQRGAEPRIWMRAGMALKPGWGPQSMRYLQWAHQAETLRVPKWNPPPDLDPDHTRLPSLLLIDERWVFVKRWEPGSEAVEQHLRLALGAGSRARVGIWRLRGPHPEPADPTPFMPPNLQTWPGSSMGIWNVSWVSTDLGPDWEMVCQPWPQEGEAWLRSVDREVRLAWLAATAVGFSLALGLWLRRSLRLQEALTSDRLAVLTHSLKTPLALHKLRCDTLRTGRLGPEAQREELMRLGQEVDDLTRLIERALVSIRGAAPQTDQQDISAAWLRAVAEDLQPAFEEAGRELELDLSETCGRAHEGSLYSALQTLLENAYHHGRGRVRLRSFPAGRCLCIEVADQGPGLEAEALGAIGKPFLRLREDGQEGFSRPGQGLGLSLLVQMARQEGWGFCAESTPGQALTMRLEIPA